MGRHVLFFCVVLHGVTALAFGDNTHGQGVRFAGLGFDEQAPLQRSQWVPWFENGSWPPQSGTYNSVGGENQIRVVATCQQDPSPDPLFALCSGTVYKLVSDKPVQDTTACGARPVRRSGRRAGPGPGPNAVPLLAIRGKWNPTPGAFEQNDQVVTFACAPTIRPKPRWLHEIQPFTGDPADSRETDLDTSINLGVLAKCYFWGFAQPKEIDQNRISTYQACLRAARAEYCGGGISQTEQGTIIQVYEPKETQAKPIRVSLDSPYCANPKNPKSSEIVKSRVPLGFKPCFEALWDTDGAVCVSHARFLQMPVQDCKNNFKYEFSVELRNGDVFAFPAVKSDYASLNCQINNYQTAVQRALVKNRSGLNSLNGAPVQSCTNDIPCP